MLDNRPKRSYNGFYQGNEETSSLPGHDLQRASGRCEEAFVPTKAKYSSELSGERGLPPVVGIRCAGYSAGGMAVPR